MTFNHSSYQVNNPLKSSVFGDYVSFTWSIINREKGLEFFFTTKTSLTRVTSRSLKNDNEILKDAWPFVKYYLDQCKEQSGFTISIQSNSELGSFYTPTTVVSGIMSLLSSLKNVEDKKIHRWQTHIPPHYPMVIDPACGEGIFLKQAIASGLTEKEWIFGLDIDPEAVDKWETTNLLQEFEGDKRALKAHFFHQNGLLPIQWSQHKEYYQGKIKRKHQELQQFDYVVGNPPYGGLGIYKEMKSLLDMLSQSQNSQSVEVVHEDLFGAKVVETYKEKKSITNESLPKEVIKELVALSKTLQGYSIWKDENRRPKEKKDTSVLLKGVTVNFADLLDSKEIDRLKSFPIEVLFLEKFIKLAKTPNKNKKGGVIAVIVPDGILSNSSMDFVRKFISSHTKVLGILSLPRTTFKEAKTNAKTSILILEKTNNENEQNNYPVFLASIPKINDEYFATIKQYFEFFMANQQSQLIDENSGIMIRSDKTLEQLNAELPSGRWDLDHWRIDFEEILTEMRASRYKIQLLSDFSTEMTTNNHVKKIFIKNENATKYYQTETVQNTGLLYYLCKYVAENGPNDPQRTRLKYGDLMIIRSGTGSLGRVFCYTKNYQNANTVESVFIVRVKGISPFYLAVFLLTKYGQAQLFRNANGVSGIININQPELECIEIPVLEEDIQKQIEAQYILMNETHDLAMAAIISNNEQQSQHHLQKSARMLADLVGKVEQIIRGDQTNAD